jgi:hypothetical protein
MLADMLAIEDREPDAEHDKTGGEGEEMRRVEEVEDAASGGEQRKGANAARTPGVAVREKILESEAKEQAQTEKEPRAGQ